MDAELLDAGGPWSRKNHGHSQRGTAQSSTGLRVFRPGHCQQRSHGISPVKYRFRGVQRTHATCRRPEGWSLCYKP